MEKQVYNPYMPLYEYVPDGEPHIFENRLYVYGSHDQFGAFAFCHNDYVTWSCPLDDLTDWRYEGVIYKKTQDPKNKGRKDYFAPDVTQGPDGNYYLYYGLDFTGLLGVAKSSSPKGPFEFLGHIKNKDGSLIGCKLVDIFHFDPGVLTDTDGRVYLYSGFGPNHIFPQIRPFQHADGCYVMEMEPDMVTVKSGPTLLIPKINGKGMHPSFKGHEFFEASSIRHIGDTYYLIYSSINGHELCYATSKSPFGPFIFGGTIISNGDVYLNGRKKEDACYPLGNNHGGLVKVNNDWYIFYHRHTNFTNTDRQAMAEKVYMKEDGSIPQVEMTSCGLNGKDLIGQGEYPSTICCCLKPKEGNVFYPFFKTPHQKKHKTYITQSGKDSDTINTQYIENIQDGCLVGYKYFDLSNTEEISLHLKSKDFVGKVSLRYEENGENLNPTDINIKDSEAVIVIKNMKKEVHLPLYFYFEGTGKIAFDAFSLK